MNVLLIGHACGPGLGSEPGNTWNCVQNLSRKHNVWVLTHPQYRSGIDAWLAANPNPNLRFVWVEVNSAIDPWKPARGEQGIRVHYLLWLKVAYTAAAKLCQEITFDVAHHLSWGTLRAVPPLWQLPVPAIWGPLGGAQFAPLRFLRYFGGRGWQEVLRSLSAKTLPFSPALRKAARSAALVLATNKETEQLLKRTSGCNAKLMLDCGLPADWMPAEAPPPRHSSEFTLLWVGRLEHRKALALGLQALARVRTPVHLVVAGSGPLRKELEILAAKLGLAGRVRFAGSVPYQAMTSLFQSSDAFLFTSLRDSFGSVVLEAMAQGLPIVTLDHHGVGTFVPAEAGIKVPVTAPRETAEALAAAIEKLAQSPALLRSMQLAGWNFAREQTWERRAEQMSKIYEEAVSRRQGRVGTSNAMISPVRAEL